jgi:hypothetical protein
MKTFIDEYIEQGRNKGRKEGRQEAGYKILSTLLTDSECFGNPAKLLRKN